MTDGLVTEGKRTILRLEGIRKVVPLPDAPPLTILDGVDLEVGEGDHVSVVGRSGSGKSALLNILGLIDEPKQANDIVTGGRADMVALARAILADPRWPWRAAAELGHEMKVAPQLARAAHLPKKWVEAA